VITLRSPFNGDTIHMTVESCPPEMLAALIQAGFVHVNASKTKSKQQKEHRDGTSENDGS
jgi:hypothetical protein